MSEAKSFPTAAVVSSVLGTLLCDIGEVYKCLSFLVGRSVYTHEIPDAGRLCYPHVVEAYPLLAEVTTDDINRDNWREKLAAIEAKLGKTMTLAPLGGNQLADKTPLETLQEKVDPERIIVIGSGQPEGNQT